MSKLTKTDKLNKELKKLNKMAPMSTSKFSKSDYDLQKRIFRNNPGIKYAWIISYKWTQKQVKNSLSFYDWLIREFPDVAKKYQINNL